MALTPGQDLPRIPGIDQAELLDRVGADIDLFWELLQELSRGYRDLPAGIAEGLECNVQEAERLAHTLKGVLGNLAAKALYATCCDLHQAIRYGDRTRCPALLKRLSADLPALCDAIDAAAPTPDTSEPAGDTTDHWLRMRYRDLARALRDNRVRECKVLINALTAENLPDSVRGTFPQLEQMVRSYRFEEALALIENHLRGK